MKLRMRFSGLFAVFFSLIPTNRRWIVTHDCCSSVKNTLFSCFSFISLNLSMVTPTNKFMTKKDPTMMKNAKKRQ